MNILFITPRIPYPPLKGDQTVAFHRLRTLGIHHQITLLTFVEGNEDPGAEAALKPFCKRIIRVPHPKWRIGMNLLFRGLWTQIPLQVTYYRSPAFQSQARMLMQSGEFDLVHGFTLRLRPYLEQAGIPVVLECIDSMRLNFTRQVKVAKSWRRWVYREELRRLESYEPLVDQSAERVIFVSSLDAEASGSKKAMVLPIGVEIPSNTASRMEPVVVFTGNMGYSPNILAVKWFVRHCWGSIHRAIPMATFRIVGSNPHASVIALQEIPGVEVIGYVEDMMLELMEASVSVAPMQSGSGMQFKILEAMACGLPVVTSTLGKGAIAAIPGEEIVLADTPEAMCEAVCRLLKDPVLRMDLGDKGRAFVMTHHSWEQSARELEAKWLACIQKVPNRIIDPMN